MTKEHNYMLHQGLVEEILGLCADDPVLFLSLFMQDGYQNLRIHSDCNLSPKQEHDFIQTILLMGNIVENCRLLWEEGCFDSLFFQH